jgi:hypothetical protein
MAVRLTAERSIASTESAFPSTRMVLAGLLPRSVVDRVHETELPDNCLPVAGFARAVGHRTWPGTTHRQERVRPVALHEPQAQFRPLALSFGPGQS